MNAVVHLQLAHLGGVRGVAANHRSIHQHEAARLRPGGFFKLQVRVEELHDLGADGPLHDGGEDDTPGVLLEHGHEFFIARALGGEGDVHGDDFCARFKQALDDAGVDRPRPRPSVFLHEAHGFGLLGEGREVGLVEAGFLDADDGDLGECGEAIAQGEVLVVGEGGDVLHHVAVEEPRTPADEK